MIDDVLYIIGNGFDLHHEVASSYYGAQNEAYMSRSAEKLVRGLCFNELGVGG